jgi:hypothetical protein
MNLARAALKATTNVMLQKQRQAAVRRAQRQAPPKRKRQAP